MKVTPISFRAACDFVQQLHRHNKPPRGHKFSVGLRNDAGELVGVAMAGRPIARHFDDGLTLEVNRTCTDGTKNANSMLYGAVWRAAKAMGYQRCITYTQADESGASLRAAGYVLVRELAARKSWADSSVKMRAMRDVQGNGGVERRLWEIKRADAQEEAKAIAHAEECIDAYRGESVDGWDEQVDQVCWGEIKAKATQTGLRKSTEDDETCCDMYCDYELKDVMQEQKA